MTRDDREMAMSGLREECGVFGIWSGSGMKVAHDIYCGLMSLQHRGQESAGIAVCDTSGPEGNLCVHKDMGLVSEVFDEDILASLKGNIGIGHVRYSTTGDSSIENAQPLTYRYMKGTLSVVHNGNIVNAPLLKEELMNEGMMFRATTDSEVIATLVAKMRAKTGRIEEAIKMAAPKLVGGYAVIIMSPRKLVAMRDPLGIKPMCLGRIDDGWVIASESCALHSIGAEFVRDVEPGEILCISGEGITSDRQMCGEKHAHCIFEYIYFSRLDSEIDGISVHASRINGGRALAEAYPVDADIVTGVPESGLAAAMGYSIGSGIPFAMVFHKNSYVGRTFIKPTTKERQAGVRLKLNVIADVVKDKRVVLIDDSIVRGTTITNLITMMRDAGAKEVHVRISSPPFLHPCYYGTDVPDNTQLIANRFSTEEIRNNIGADSLGYMRLEDLPAMTGDLGLCRACFDGDYPTEV